MFSAKLTRVAVPRATSTASISTSATAAVSRPAPCVATTRTHQRRHSSSKASCPPDNNKPAPDAKAASSQDAARSPTSAAESQPRTSGKRATRHKRSHSSPMERMNKTKQSADQFAGLPVVRGVQHLHTAEFGLSSFFSMHRPLSLSTTIPPPTSNEAFNAIFESSSQTDPWRNGNSAERRPEDVIYTLHNTIVSLEGPANGAQEEGMRWEVIQESPSGDAVKHLDGAPKMKSLEELAATFKPFHPPPPPQAFADEAKAPSKKRGVKQAKSTQQSASKQKNYMATIKLTESTLPNGESSWTASQSHMVRIADSPSMKDPSSTHRQPFVERMRRRQQLYLQSQQTKRVANPAAQRFVRRAPSARRFRMVLISVKRQRKLKMKKHKYKKLMKRTRNLRRRLDRN